MYFRYIDVRLWDPEDVSRLAVIETETKKTVKLLTMATDEQESDEEDANDGDHPWISKLGLDDHSAMSFAAGLLRPPFIGAWQLLQVNYNCSVRLMSELHQALNSVVSG